MRNRRPGVPYRSGVQPRQWCYPVEAFGKITDHPSGALIQTRVWRPPATSEHLAPNEWAAFRAAVIQNAYAVHLRAHKNALSPKVTREMLGEADERPDAFSKWTARLNGTAGWNLDDTAVILRLYPGALPDWPTVRIFIDVATGVRQPPPNWTWPDTAGPAQQI